jgi:hypothetical protein
MTTISTALEPVKVFVQSHLEIITAEKSTLFDRLGSVAVLFGSGLAFAVAFPIILALSTTLIVGTAVLGSIAIFVIGLGYGALRMAGEVQDFIERISLKLA